jgi:phosphate transport system substrate-binding protein
MAATFQRGASRSCAALVAVAAIALATTASALDGAVAVDGSSTVYPITKAVAERFQRLHPGVTVEVSVSGTSGGFRKLCAGETDIADASRPINAAEAAACRQNGVRYVELPVAFDGLAVVVHPSNAWADCITVRELKALWEPAAQGKIARWNQVRSGWPESAVHLFGPDLDSGTYDYFTEAIVGKEHSSRLDYDASADDEVIARGVAEDPLSLGYFGVAYYEEHKGTLKLLAVDDEREGNGKGCVLPTAENVEAGLYQPLARPVFIYVARRAMERPEVQALVKDYLQQGAAIVREIGYVPLPRSAYENARARFDRRVYGSVFGGRGSQVGVTVADLAGGTKP